MRNIGLHYSGSGVTGWLYTDETLRAVVRLVIYLAVIAAVCLFLAPTRGTGPDIISPFDIVTIYSPSSAGSVPLSVKVPRSKERFAVAWPRSLTMGTPDEVVVRIAANDYEDLIADLDLTTKKVIQETFPKAVGNLEVTLSGDSGTEITKRNHDEQVVLQGAS